MAEGENLKVTCETCGEETWSDRYPCCNCDTAPPVSNWSPGFRFDQALRGMRLGKRVRRQGWDRTWSIEDGVLTIRWPDPAGEEDAVAPAFELHEDDILAEDWEVTARWPTAHSSARTPARSPARPST